MTVNLNNDRLAKTYDKTFYANQAAGSSLSASIVVPYILEIIPGLNSVIDFGCGAGTWLREFQLNGIEETLGLDGGDPTSEYLLLDEKNYINVDLSRPYKSSKKFDLAISLEVAEHLSEEFAEIFIENLTNASDCIVFGAAIPGQGGEDHIHERWPSYWISLFEKKGYVLFDIFRAKFWHDSRVEWWYSQNTFLFVNKSNVMLLKHIYSLNSLNDGRLIIEDCVHPSLFMRYRNRELDCAKLQRNLSLIKSELENIKSNPSFRLLTLLQYKLARFPLIKRIARKIIRTFSAE